VTLQTRLLEAQRQLASALGLPAGEARIEAQVLMQNALGGVTRAWLITHDRDRLSDEQSSAFDGLLQRRLRGEPVAYILGRREFYGLAFAVGPGVLIPRPDTETLVEAALQRIPLAPSPQPSPASGRGLGGEGNDAARKNKNSPQKTKGNYRILDLGTGSGAIAIAVAVHRPAASVVAVDRSETALDVARRNADTLGADNLQVLQSDWFGALNGQVFDVIVSNPPYIAEADPHLQQGDLRFEPSGALASGADGLDDIRAILMQAPAHLAKDGWLLLEHGYDQAERVEQLMRDAGFEEIGHAVDLAGMQRVTFGRKS
jgi:release factor glutamine methyltransferase